MIFDSVTGARLGHGIRFTIRPDFWNNNMCAERLWKVVPQINADIPQHQPDFPNVVLRQVNAFGSQLCGQGGHEQITRAGASTNLAIDELPATFLPPRNFASIELVPADPELSRQQLTNLPFSQTGSSFAGRGLYGDYVLLFPFDPTPCAPGLSECSGWSDDALGQVLQIFLRFEIVASTLQSQLQTSGVVDDSGGPGGVFSE
jgi:hypothetical protein